MCRVGFHAVVAGLLALPVAAGAKELKTLYNFTQPMSAQGEFAVDGTGLMYGTSSQGGSAGLGSLFSFDPRTRAMTVLYSFVGGSDGANPVAGMVLSKGVLIGATAAGGSANDGTVFSFDTKTGVEQVLHSFSGTDGKTPQYPPTMAVDGTLYGTTSVGGKSGYGLVYKLNPRTGAEKVLFNFDGTATYSDRPNALTVSTSGLLYGSCYGGAFAGDFGNLFTLDPQTGMETVLYRFSSNDGGQSPTYGVILGKNGLIYGTGAGDAFQYDPTTGKATDLDLHDGGGYGGSRPSGNLVTDKSGNLDVATESEDGGGAAYEYDVSAKTGTRLLVFDSVHAHQGYPPYGIVVGKNGDLYGTTLHNRQHGQPAYGTIFSLAP